MLWITVRNYLAHAGHELKGPTVRFYPVLYVQQINWVLSLATVPFCTLKELEYPSNYTLQSLL